MKVDKGFVLVVGLMVGCILAAFGNLTGFGMIAGIALSEACK